MKILVSLAAACALSVPVLAQSQSIAESIEVRVTNVDVVVTDRAGNAVVGLTKDDFEVLEGGKPQPITNFYEIRQDTVAGAALASDSEPAPEEITRRRLVVFVDNFSIHPLARNAAFAALEQSLDTLMRPGDEAMLVFWNGRQEIVAPLTSDRNELIAKLRAAAGRTSGGMTIETAKARIVEHASQMLADARTPGGSYKITPEQAYTTSLESARNFAEELMAAEQSLLGALSRTLGTLAGVEGKKALIFLGAELPDTPGMELFQQLDSMFKFDVPDIRPANIRELSRNLSAELRKVAHDANANGVTMYLVDTANRVRGGDPTEHMAELEAVFASETNTPMAMATLASITGGVAVPGGKSFEMALDRIERDLSSYYSLGYRSPDDDSDSRRVTVKVKRPGLRVRSRSSYIARSSDDDIETRVIANVFHSSVKSDFPVSVEAAAPERTNDGLYRVKLTVTMPSTMTFIPRDGSLVGEFAVYFATGNETGGTSEVTKSRQPMTFPGDAMPAIEAQKVFTYQATLLVRPGEQFVSVGVTDVLAGTSGFARTKVVAR